MSDLLGMGGNPPWLSDATRARIRSQEAAEAAETRRAGQAQADRREQLHQRALVLYREQAEARGESVDVLGLAGGFGGRTFAELRDAARAGAEQQDARDAARARRETDNPLPIGYIDEPTIVMTPVKRSMMQRSRRFRDWQAKKTAAENARRALEEDSQLVFARPVVPQRHASARSERSATLTAATAPGFGPYNVPWAQVGQWLGAGWRP
jgi:hypothetical protein